MLSIIILNTKYNVFTKNERKWERSLSVGSRIIISTDLRIYIILSPIFTSIYIFCLSVCVLVCLLVSNKRQNGWTDQAQLFYGTFRMTPGKVYGWSNFQKFATNKIQFLKILKSTIFIKNVNFVFVLQCIQKEHVHNWNRRWALSALKAYLVTSYPKSVYF